MITQETTAARVRSRRRRAGFTLPELVVAITLLIVVVGAAVGLLVSTVRGMTSQREVTSTEDGLRTFENVISQALRAAAANPWELTVANRPRIEPNPLNRATWDNVRLLSDMNPADRDMLDNLEDVQFDLTNDTIYVRWQSGATKAPLVAPVSRLLFEYFQADGTTPITTAANIALARQVRITVEAPRKVGSSQLVRRQWTVQLRNRF